MKNVILFLWQLPQNILGFFMIIFLDAYKPCFDPEKEFWIYYKTRFSSFSLGYFVVMNGFIYSEIDLKHEFGHQKQSIYLGWLYIPIIGIPSFLGNIWDRIFHKGWKMNKRKRWYYSLPWEKWADKLGYVKRNYLWGL